MTDDRFDPQQSRRNTEQPAAYPTDPFQQALLAGKRQLNQEDNDSVAILGNN